MYIYFKIELRTRDLGLYLVDNLFVMSSYRYRGVGTVKSWVVGLKGHGRKVTDFRKTTVSSNETVGTLSDLYGPLTTEGRSRVSVGHILLINILNPITM